MNDWIEENWADIGLSGVAILIIGGLLIKIYCCK